MEQLLDKWDTAGCRLRCLTCGFVMAQVYAQLLHLADQPPGRGPTDRSAACYQEVLTRYRACIDSAQTLGTTAMQGRIFLALGDLYLTADNLDAARDAYQESITFFKQSGAGVYLHQAGEKLENLKKNHG